jgi:hypothetical protein
LLGRLEVDQNSDVLNRNDDEHGDEYDPETEHNLSVTIHIEAFKDLGNMLVQCLTNMIMAHIGNKDTQFYSEKNLVDGIGSIIDSL